MSFIKALILGIVQGLTEFLPISSTAHLTLVGKWLKCIDPNNPEQWTAFIAVMQLGTVLAVLLYFTTDLIDITKEFIGGNIDYLQKRTLVLSPNARLGWYIIFGSIPIVVVGLLFKKSIEGVLTKSLTVIAVSLIVWAVVLFLAEHYGRLMRTVEQLTIIDAMFVGFFQMFALIPGSSRSGTTISAGLFMGLTRASAARFSFLLSIPSVAGAGIYEFLKSYRNLTPDMSTALITATVAAAIVGYLSIALLIKYLQTHSTNVFIIYRILLGVTILVLLRFGKVTP